MMFLTSTTADNVKPYVHLQPNYIGAKSGLIAAGQMPLAVFLALKNNPITCEYAYCAQLPIC